MQYDGVPRVCCRCDVNGTEMETPTQAVDVEPASACDAGGAAHACLDQVPWVSADDDQTAFAFAATPGNNPQGTCGTCFELLFTGASGVGHQISHDAGARRLKGKRLIVQATNIGYDVAANQFDVMIPGGGVGLFDACSTQWGVDGRNVSLGKTYGGVLAECLQAEPATRTDLDARKACVRRMCARLYAGVPRLASQMEGCLWFVEWYEAADNPRHDFRPIECPTALAVVAGAGFARDPALYLRNSTSVLAGGTSPSAAAVGEASGGSAAPPRWAYGAGAAGRSDDGVEVTGGDQTNAEAHGTYGWLHWVKIVAGGAMIIGGALMMSMIGVPTPLERLARFHRVDPVHSTHDSQHASDTLTAADGATADGATANDRALNKAAKGARASRERDDDDDEDETASECAEQAALEHVAEVNSRKTATREEVTRMLEEVVAEKKIEGLVEL